jgi:hypothetical protein
MAKSIPPTIEQMRRHIEELVHCYNIVCWTHARRPADAWAIHLAEEINIASIRSQFSYAVALHEIGHIKGRYQRSRSSPVREGWAWEWARMNALVWTAAMERYCQRALVATGL